MHCFTCKCTLLMCRTLCNCTLPFTSIRNVCLCCFSNNYSYVPAPEFPSSSLSSSLLTMKLNLNLAFFTSFLDVGNLLHCGSMLLTIFAVGDLFAIFPPYVLGCGPTLFTILADLFLLSCLLMISLLLALFFSSLFFSFII